MLFCLTEDFIKSQWDDAWRVPFSLVLQNDIFKMVSSELLCKISCTTLRHCASGHLDPSQRRSVYRYLDRPQKKTWPGAGTAFELARSRRWETLSPDGSLQMLSCWG